MVGKLRLNRTIDAVEPFGANVATGDSEGAHKLALRPEKQPRQGSWHKGQATWR